MPILVLILALPFGVYLWGLMLKPAIIRLDSFTHPALQAFLPFFVIIGAFLMVTALVEYFAGE